MADNSSSGSVGFSTLLGLIFIVLKLTHTIAWSWWWVLAPFWISFVLGVFLAVILLWSATSAKKAGR